MNESTIHDLLQAVRFTTWRVRHVALAGALLLPEGVPSPHPEGILELATKSFASGDSLTIAGRNFERNDAVALILVGVTGRAELTNAATDSAGAFRVRVFVPASLKPGAYRLVAEAVDGDEVGTLDVIVLATTSGPVETHDPASHAIRGQPAMPTAEPLDLNRAESPGLAAITWLAILAFVGVGLTLIRTAEPLSKER